MKIEGLNEWFYAHCIQTCTATAMHTVIYNVFYQFVMGYKNWKCSHHFRTPTTIPRSEKPTTIPIPMPIATAIRIPVIREANYQQELLSFNEVYVLYQSSTCMGVYSLVIWYTDCHSEMTDKNYDNQILNCQAVYGTSWDWPRHVNHTEYSVVHTTNSIST